jgi:peptide/nickel transport system substrate-binding protein
VNVLVNLYDGLIAYHDETVELVPALAEKWESSNDGLTWTFHLRPNVKFHDGTPCDAAAVVFNFERQIVPDHPNVYHGVPPYSPSFAMIEKVEAADPQTVVFKLKHPSAIFLKNIALFAAGICSPTAVKKYAKEYGLHPVGTGPYKLGIWKRQEELVLEAVPDHWRGPARNTRVIFVPVAEHAVRIAQLKRGEIDIADNLPAVELKALAGAPGIKFQKQPGMNVGYLAFQTKKGITANRKFRKGIACAIDKARLIEVAYAGAARPAVNMMPASFLGYNSEIVDRKVDLEKAKKLIEEAAAENGEKLPLSLRLFVMQATRPYMQQPKETATFIRDAVKPLGVNLEIRIQENNLHFQSLSRGEHDLALAGWTSDAIDPDTFLYSLLDPDNINDAGGNNMSRYDNPEVHRLLLAAQKELDEEKRAAMYRQVQVMAFEDVPTIPLAHTDLQIAHREALQGYVLHPSSLTRMRHAWLQGSGP